MTDELHGRALDAAIAERVMGWKIHFRNTAHYVLECEEGTAYNRPQAMHDWSPSTDHNAAALVIERMRELGWDCEMHCYDDGPNDAEFSRPSMTGFYAESCTLPVAICKAALSAIGGVA